jgi:uncharacterized membrane protein
MKWHRFISALVVSLLVVFSFISSYVLAGGNDGNKTGPSSTCSSAYWSLSLFLFLGFLLLVFVIVVVAIVWLKRREQERYEDVIEDLKKQFDLGKISEETYKELRLDIEEKYHKRMKRMGF